MHLIGTIDIFRGTGSLSAREYPYLAQGATINPVPIKSFQGKFTEDLDQAIQVPEFDGWSSCNLLRLTSGAFVQWMWITDVSRTSDSAGSITLACTWCPTMDISRRDDYSVVRSYVGNWVRRPSVDLTSPIHFEIAGGQEKFQTQMAAIRQCSYYCPIDSLVGVLCWVQITFSQGSGSNAGIGQYGFFADIAYPRDGIRLGGGNGTDIWHKYPTFLEVLTSPYAALGVTASSIIDISVSAIPPVKPQGVRSSLPVVNIEYGSGGTVGPTLPAGSQYYVYDMSSGSATMPGFEQNQNLTYSNVQAYCGSMRLMDPWGACIGVFPQTSGTGSGYTTHKMTARAITDTTGITLKIELDGTVLKVPMPHVPYVGTQWDEYRAYAMSFDRQAMEWSISSSREALNIQKDSSAMSTAVSVGSSLLSGNIMGAVTSTLGTLIGMSAQDRSQELMEKNARFSQTLTENMAMAATPTTYSAGYGFADILQMGTFGYRIVWWAPSGTDALTFARYIEENGCPVKKVNASTSMELEGFYQGCIASKSAPIHGARLDRLNDLLQTGFKQVLYKDVQE